MFQREILLSRRGCAEPRTGDSAGADGHNWAQAIGVVKLRATENTATPNKRMAFQVLFERTNDAEITELKTPKLSKDSYFLGLTEPPRLAESAMRR